MFFLHTNVVLLNMFIKKVSRNLIGKKVIDRHTNTVETLYTKRFVFRTNLEKISGLVSGIDNLFCVFLFRDLKGYLRQLSDLILN